MYKCIYNLKIIFLKNLIKGYGSWKQWHDELQNFKYFEYNADMFQCLCHIIKHNNNDNINILIKNSTMTKLVPVMYIY